jgi:predicted P-loop ATPase
MGKILNFIKPTHPAVEYTGWQVTLYRSHYATDREGQIVDGENLTVPTVNELLESYEQPQWLSADAPIPYESTSLKQNSACVTAALIAKGERREHAAAGLARVLFVDFDNGRDGTTGLTADDVAGLRDALQVLGKLAVVHTTTSTPFLTDGRVKLRAVFPLLEPVDPAGYKRLWVRVSEHVNAATGLLSDKTKAHSADLMYLPVWHRAHAESWKAWRVCESADSEALLWDLPLAEVSLTSGDSPYEAVRCAKDKHAVLNRQAFIMGARWGKLASDTDSVAIEAHVASDVWPELKRALEANTSSEGVKDWAAAERTVLRAFSAGAEKTAGELSEKLDAYRKTLLAELREQTSVARLEVCRTVDGRSCKPLEAELERTGTLLASDLGMPADELSAVQGRVTRAVETSKNSTVQAKLAAALLAGLAKPIDVRVEYTSAEQSNARKNTQDEWSLILDKDGWTKVNSTNLEIVLNEDPKLRGLLLRNAREEDEVIIQRDFGSWEASRPVKMMDFEGFKWIRNYMAKSHDMPDLERADFDKGMQHFLEYLPMFDPLVTWLNDNKTEPCPVEQLETFFVRYGLAQDTPLIRAYTRAMFVSAVRTVFEPGAQVDLIWVLTGAPLLGKSALIKSLVPHKKYFGEITNDEISGGSSSDGGRKPMETLSTKWLIEVPEIELKYDKAKIWKSLISSTTARFRPSYGQRKHDFPRRGIMIATSNHEVFLKDPTGNRKFAPIPLSQDRDYRIDQSQVVSERESLWACALQLYRLDPGAYTIPENLYAAAREHTDALRVQSTEEIMLQEYTDGLLEWPSHISQLFALSAPFKSTAPDAVGQLTDRPLALTGTQLSALLQCKDSGRCSDAAKSCGWTVVKSTKFTSDGKQHRLWVHPDKLATLKGA